MWESVNVLCFVVRYFMSILVLQSSWWGRESWLLCLICLPGVSLWLGGSSSRCHRVVCSLWLWYFLIILTYYFWLNFLIIGGVCRISHMTKPYVTELIRGVNHFHSLLDKPIKLEISLKSSLRCSQHECKSESAKTEVNFS